MFVSNNEFHQGNENSSSIVKVYTYSYEYEGLWICHCKTAIFVDISANLHDVSIFKD